MSNAQYFISPCQLVDSDQLILFYGNNIVADGDNYLWGKSDVEKLLSPALVCFIVEKSERRVIALELNSDISERLSATCRSLRSFLFGEDAVDVGEHEEHGKHHEQVQHSDRLHVYVPLAGAPVEYRVPHVVVLVRVGAPDDPGDAPLDAFDVPLPVLLFELPSQHSLLVFSHLLAPGLHLQVASVTFGARLHLTLV